MFKSGKKFSYIIYLLQALCARLHVLDKLTFVHVINFTIVFFDI